MQSLVLDLNSITTVMEFKIYIYTKPCSDDQIIYKTFDAAVRACRRGGIIEEWSCTDLSDRFILTNSWRREKQLVRQSGGDGPFLEFQE